MPKILGTTIDTRTVERGQPISLNLKLQPFLGVPGMSLNAGHPTMVVPKDLPEASLQLLRAAHGRGLILLGNIAPKVEVKDDLGDLCFQIDAATTPAEMAKTFDSVSRGTKRIMDPTTEKPMMPSEVIQRLLDHEIRKQCRDDFINWIADIRDQTPGHAVVTETQEAPVQVNLPKGAPGRVKTPEQQKTVDELF